MRHVACHQLVGVDPVLFVPLRHPSRESTLEELLHQHEEIFTGLQVAPVVISPLFGQGYSGHVPEVACLEGNEIPRVLAGGLFVALGVERSHPKGVACHLSWIEMFVEMYDTIAFGDAPLYLGEVNGHRAFGGLCQMAIPLCGTLLQKREGQSSLDDGGYSILALCGERHGRHPHANHLVFGVSFCLFGVGVGYYQPPRLPLHVCEE